MRRTRNFFLRRGNIFPSPGDRFDERYVLEAQLGASGGNAVFKALDTRLNRQVAIKILNPTEMDSQGLERLQREALTIARLNHPSIVTLYDFAMAEGRLPYLALEFIEGDDLWSVLYEKQRVFSLIESVKLCLKILDALDYAHQQGVIHRDLKPENVMMTGDSPKVMDFGLAYIRGQRRITQEGVIAGSAFYLAPEVAAGKHSDQRVDLYALGVMLYELTTGQLPFHAENQLAVINQHLYEVPRHPSELNPELSPTLEAIILKLLAKSPDDRFESARAVMEALIALDQAPAQLQRNPAQQILERITRTRLMGREGEWTRLRDAWHKVQLRSLEVHPVVMLAGEAGTGKNELAQQLVVEARQAGARVFVTQCFQNTATQPYQPFLEILRDCIRQYPHMLTVSMATDLAKLLPELAHEHSIERLPPLTAEAERLRLYDHLTEFFIAVARQQPLLLVVEYMHCTDSSSLAMLHYLARRIKGQPIFIVGTYRPSELDHRHPLTTLVRELISQDLLEQIVLRRLTAEEVTDLVVKVFGSDLSPNLTKIIFDKTQGNIFFTREILKSLVDVGHVKWDTAQKRWQVHHLESLELPSSIRSIISQQLSRMSETAVQVLRHAAVIGSEFRFKTLAAIVEMDEETLSEALEEALTAQLIFERKSNRDESYVFINSATHETLLENLNQRRQARLHLKIAQALEKLYPNADNIEMIARHYSLGARTDEEINHAITYLEKAAERASHIFALPSAIDLYTTALELSQDDTSPQREQRVISLRQGRGTVYQQMGDFAAAAQDLEAALQWVSNDTQQKRAVLLELGQVYRRLERFDGAIKALTDAVAISRTLHDERLVADALYYLGATYWSLGQITQSLVHQEEGYEIITRLGLRDEVAMRVLHGLAESNGRKVDYAMMFKLAEESIHLGRELGDLEYEAENLTIIATAEVDQGYFERAQATLEHMLNLCKSAGMNWHLTAAQSIDGMAKAATGDYREGLGILKSVSEIALKQYKGFLQTLSLTNLGRCYLHLEALPQADEALSLAMECGQRHRISWSDACTKGYWAMVQIRQGNLEVGALLETALEQALSYGDIRHVPILYAALAELELARQNPAEALKWAENMYVLASRIDQPIQVVEANRLRGAALLALHNLQEAETLLETALEDAVGLRYPRLTWKIHETLAEVYNRHQKPEAATKCYKRVRGIIEDFINNVDDLALKKQLSLHLPKINDTLTTTLRLLVLTDTYGSMVRQAMQANLADVLRCDALILLGDLPQQVYPSLRQDFGLTMPGFCVFGNHDNEAWEEWLPRYKFEHLHLRLATLKIGGREITLGGFSGSEQYRTQEMSVLQWDEREAAQHIRNLPPCDILLTHTAGSPPPNYPLERTHRGLKSIGDYIERHHPKVALHGHFHENYQRQQGETLVVGCYGAVLMQCMITTDTQWQIEIQPLAKV